jgi:hypothetical protein
MSDNKQEIIISDKSLKVFLPESRDGNYMSIKELVIAVITIGSKQQPIDWAAYKGCVLGSTDQIRAIELVAGYGDKILYKEALQLIDSGWWIGEPPNFRGIPYRGG